MLHQYLLFIFNSGINTFVIIINHYYRVQIERNTTSILNKGKNKKEKNKTTEATEGLSTL